MSTQVDLKQLEKNAFKSNFQDGLWDIYLGVLLLQMGLWSLLDGYPLSEFWEIVILLGTVSVTLAAFIVMKKYVIMPRMGVASFSTERKRKKRKVTVVLSLSVGMGIGMYVAAMIFGNGSNPAGEYSWLIPAGLFFLSSVIVFSLMAYYLDYTRAYLYGWLYGLSFVLNIALAEMVGISWPLFTFLSAAIMIGIGLVLFVRFMISHPILAEEPDIYGEI